eukprot:TRINITY_DN1502_c0_g1_i1.p1 TRINITY_DN1502_c0_g1~~TRINITY_DN1502_c0_g1_i1.p1  ORF type:complete len:486 (+),score=194.59 TRINITY_DN1502_c0_g1_i1:77-1534(+)
MARVVDAQVTQAVEALLKHYEGHLAKKSGKELISDDEDFQLVIAVKKIPEQPKSAKPIRVPIPHSFLTGMEMCIFTPDEQKHYRDLLIEAHAVPNLKKVVSISKLRSNYKRHEAKRKLLNSYDVFFVDKSVVPLVAPLLGREWYRSKKQPIPVELGKKNVLHQFTKAQNATYLHPPRGATFTIKVGRTSQHRDQIVANILAALDPVIQRIPKRWDNIQSINVKTSRSPALPLYTSLPEMSTVIQAEGSIASTLVRKRKRSADDTGEKKEEKAKNQNKNQNKNKNKNQSNGEEKTGEAMEESDSEEDADNNKAEDEESEEAEKVEEEEEKAALTKQKKAATPNRGKPGTPKKQQKQQPHTTTSTPATPTTPTTTTTTTPTKPVTTTPTKKKAAAATAATPSPARNKATPPPPKKQKVAATPPPGATASTNKVPPAKRKQTPATAPTTPTHTTTKTNSNNNSNSNNNNKPKGRKANNNPAATTNKKK